MSDFAPQTAAGKVLWHFTMSLDGFVAGPDHDMSWMATGISMQPGLLEPYIETTGAVLAGRRGWDAFPSAEFIYGGAFTGPVFVMTHHPEDAEPADRVTFLNCDLAEAVQIALTAADGKNVEVLSADIGRQLLQRGLLDEIDLHIAPVLLGQGIRLYERLRLNRLTYSAGQIESNSPACVLTERVTMPYGVVRATVRDEGYQVRMAEPLYKVTTWSVSMLVGSIDQGKVALPDIQRPFVWPASKVRDLLDSMYRGFPVGSLLFWSTGVEAGARQIGLGESKAAPQHLIVDGQQRLTSLYAVMTGRPVLREDYSEARIRIAFRPSDGTFAVTDAAIEKDPEYIPDISVLWRPGSSQIAVIRDYFNKLRRDIDTVEENRLAQAISDLAALSTHSFTVIDLSADADEEQVAEIFVRINSEGVTLLQADFILTLMSVFWEKGRTDLEEFCRACRLPAVDGASPFNWYLQPQPSQMLRATVAVALRRAVLKNVYTVLRGKDLETGRSSPERREAQFARLAEAQEQVLDLANWHDFLLCLERAGFRGKRMISSENAIIFSYALWLIGRVDYGVPRHKLREVIARWFFMAHTTGRYSGSFETQVEADLARLADVEKGDAEGFVAVLSKVIDDTLTTDFWEITLPNELASSASKSPALLAYIAALNILDADALLSTIKVRSRLDPGVMLKKGIERHHLFPRAYLQKLGITGTKRVNQIANMAMVDWSDNIAISDQAPAVYWPEQLADKKLSDEAIARQVHWHALPEGWTELPYDEFLIKRRKLMARVVREAFEQLADAAYAPEYPQAQPPQVAPAASARARYAVRVTDLVDAGMLAPGAILINPTDDVEASVLPDVRIDVDGTV